MTADSLPSRTADALGVEPKPAADACLFSDLLTETGQAARTARGKHSLRLDLEAVERAFGRHVRDERVRAGVIAARARSQKLVDGTTGASETIAVTFAADLFVALAVERPWQPADIRTLLTHLARALHSEPGAVARDVLVAALRAPQLLELPPLVALDVQLTMLLALSGADEASLWTRDSGGRPEAIVAVGATATTRRFRTIARETLDGQASTNESGTIVGAVVRRWQAPWGALVVRARNREGLDAVLEEAAASIGPAAEREFLLQRNAARERSLVSASERRLSRLGFDLHDGALQHVAALGADLRRLGLESLEARVKELDRVLRELAHSLEPASLLRRPVERIIEAEAAALCERTGIAVTQRVVGDFGAMTQSQKIALVRVLQEAFTNIREHSNATAVEVSLVASRSCVELQIVDNGDGFEVTRTLQDAAQRGRLGLVGSSERVRLLGGTFDIRSRPGGPTTVLLHLPRWQPLAAEADAGLGLQLAY